MNQTRSPFSLIRSTIDDLLYEKGGEGTEFSLARAFLGFHDGVGITRNVKNGGFGGHWKRGGEGEPLFLHLNREPSPHRRQRSWRIPPRAEKRLLQFSPSLLSEVFAKPCEMLMLSRNLIYRGGGLACNAMSMLFRRGSFPVINCECSSPPGMRRTSFYYRNMLRSGMQACVIVFAISPLFFRPSCHRKITTWTEHITFPENNGDAHAQARQHPVPLLKHL